MDLIKVLAPAITTGASEVLIDYEAKGLRVNAQGLRTIFDELSEVMDHSVYERLKTEEFLLIDRSHHIRTSLIIPPSEDFHYFEYTQGGGFFGRNCRDDSLWMLRNEYNGYRKVFARTLKKFRSFDPESLCIDIKFFVQAYRDVVMKELSIRDPRRIIHTS